MIFILCGTSDARELALALSREQLPLLASVVTPSAAERLEAAGITTRVGRLDQQGMIACLRELGCSAIIDASHPFAQEAHDHAMGAAAALGLPYLRYERRSLMYGQHPRLLVVSSYEEAARRAKQLKGSVMLTTGGKTLEIFAEALLGDPAIRLTVRLLPCLENMQKCHLLGIEQRNIIALQGPFSRELNEALYKQYGTQVMVTKESGAEGSLDEKVHAALDMGIYVILIARPQAFYKEYGAVYGSFEEMVSAVTAFNKK
ncbi:precorrin-6A reductase [Paenibacillus graminis]|uniref:precorrin-6A reductase n=1 Tax=Paenibacillus graminis TaxID=189425 RepID=UPI002DB77F32|nr:precorrin-6A reductase [Paenibacillus graminis]MEC0172480.1 precorrin-6A reductase [Paenibacillus graminis]